MLSKKPERFTETAALLENENLALESAESIATLAELCRKRPFTAVLLDLDTAAVDNRTVKNLSRQFPGLLLFAVSERRFHPDLQESMERFIFACLRYPVDPEELSIVMKGIGDGRAGGRNRDGAAGRRV